jgi:hypothetical protein
MLAMLATSAGVGLLLHSQMRHEQLARYHWPSLRKVSVQRWTLWGETVGLDAVDETGYALSAGEMAGLFEILPANIFR